MKLQNNMIIQDCFRRFICFLFHSSHILTLKKVFKWKGHDKGSKDKPKKENENENKYYIKRRNIQSEISGNLKKQRKSFFS